MHMAAFLRGINVGGRRPKKDELVAAVRGPELNEVSTFLASGNVLFRSEAAPDDLEATLSERLAAALGYEVATFVRTAGELEAILDDLPAPDPATKHQVVFFGSRPADDVRVAYANAAGPTDRIHWRERELLWTHQGGMSESPLFDALPTLPGPTNTVRTANTVERLTAKFR